MRRSGWLIAAGLTTVAASGGILAASRQASARIPIQRAKPVSQASTGFGTLCSGGEEPNLRVEIVPDAVIRVGNAERIEYHAELASRLNKKGAAAWSSYIVDDLGHEVTKLGKGQGAIDSGGMFFTAALAPSLPDGNYALHVRAAVVADGAQATEEALQPFAIAKGVMRELSVDDWFTKTRQAQTFELPIPPPTYVPRPGLPGAGGSK